MSWYERLKKNAEGNAEKNQMCAREHFVDYSSRGINHEIK
jgi:hypothetical protein